MAVLWRRSASSIEPNLQPYLVPNLPHFEEPRLIVFPARRSNAPLAKWAFSFGGDAVGSCDGTLSRLFSFVALHVCCGGSECNSLLRTPCRPQPSQELHYGGWVAPKIYFMGFGGVVRVGGVRIAGMTGIWNGR